MLISRNKFLSSIDRQRVLETIGYDDDSTVPARVLSMLDDFTEDTHNFVDPSYSYIIRDIQSVHGDRITVEGSVTFHSQILARLLEHCQKVGIFIATIGDRFEGIVAELATEGLVFKASLLDAIGSSAIEKIADLVHEKICEQVCGQGLLCTSRRFSPGYCDWAINQQEMIFGCMGGNTAGVHLTEEHLMLPRKSISGIIGIGDSNSQIENYNPCKSCQAQDCPGRRI
ncbi:vitamin B12 dependent-methionine synthase activation domain-containing protein [Chloroflexota bacterium]